MPAPSAFIHAELTQRVGFEPTTPPQEEASVAS